jgi:hypothetical protein
MPPDPTATTYNILLKSYGPRAHHTVVEQMMTTMARHGVRFDSITFTTGGFTVSGNGVKLSPAAGVAIDNVTGQNALNLAINLRATDGMTQPVNRAAAAVTGLGRDAAQTERRVESLGEAFDRLRPRGETIGGGGALTDGVEVTV